MHAIGSENDLDGCRGIHPQHHTRSYSCIYKSYLQIFALREFRTNSISSSTARCIVHLVYILWFNCILAGLARFVAWFQDGCSPVFFPRELFCVVVSRPAPLSPSWRENGVLTLPLTANIAAHRALSPRLPHLPFYYATSSANQHGTFYLHLFPLFFLKPTKRPLIRTRRIRTVVSDWIALPIRRTYSTSTQAPANRCYLA